MHLMFAARKVVQKSLEFLWAGISFCVRLVKAVEEEVAGTRQIPKNLLDYVWVFGFELLCATWQEQKLSMGIKYLSGLCIQQCDTLDFLYPFFLFMASEPWPSVSPPVLLFQEAAVSFSPHCRWVLPSFCPCPAESPFLTLHSRSFWWRSSLPASCLQSFSSRASDLKCFSLSRAKVSMWARLQACLLWALLRLCWSFSERSSLSWLTSLCRLSSEPFSPLESFQSSREALILSTSCF